MKTHELHLYEGNRFPDTQLTESMAPAAEEPDARIHLTDQSGGVIAHCALWWSGSPMHDGDHVGAIGGFAACDAVSTKLVLDAASARLAEAGCRVVVGPMNGNTWRRHRFVIESDGRGPFLLEPRNQADYPEWWSRAGFGVLSRYSSSIVRLGGRPTVASGLKERLERSGVTIRPLDRACYDDELRAIHAVSLRSFSSNFLYTPLDEEAFLGAYRKVRERVDPELVRIAERDGVPCGFVFCIRDLEAEARGETPALIVKTLAVDPVACCAGLGSVLVDEAHEIGFEKGYVEAIHALQHETNTSLKITGRNHGDVFRRYALFTKRP